MSLMRQMDLSEDGFGLDSEITAKLLRMGHRPFEVPVAYHARSHAHGKKISWTDGVECLSVLTRVRFAPVPRAEAPRRLLANGNAVAGSPTVIDLTDARQRLTAAGGTSGRVPAVRTGRGRGS